MDRYGSNKSWSRRGSPTFTQHPKPKYYITKNNICTLAAGNGQLEVLKWARANNYPWDANTCTELAKNGHLEMLKWARANGCPWDAKTCSEAAQNGHLEVLKWARANGCPWDINTCYNSARQGHLEVLKWAHENGCPWDERTCFIAAQNGHLEVLKWARANGCPAPSTSTVADPNEPPIIATLRNATITAEGAKEVESMKGSSFVDVEDIKGAACSIWSDHETEILNLSDEDTKTLLNPLLRKLLLGR